MKPRTKLHHKLLEYSNWLTPGVDKKVNSYALSNCNTKFGFSTGKTYWCGVCGDTHSANEIINNEISCLSCNSELHIVETKRRKYLETYYIAFAEEMFEFQVIRYFHITVNYKKGEHWKTNILESIQQFHTDNDYHLIGRLTHGYGDPLYGSMEIRNPSYYKQHAYNPYPSSYHPESTFLPQYQLKGCDGDFGNINFDGLKRKLNFNCTRTETLLKSKNIAFLKVAISDSYKISKYWNTVKICLRNKFNPLDAGIYFDYLELLDYFKKDLNSPKYACPTNLKKEHDKLVIKKRNIEKRLAIIEQKKKMKYDQQQYEKDKGNYFGLVIENGNISIKVLETIQEFIEEGDAHKHCVYTNKYYSKENSLILSARVNGKLVETIEIKLDEMKIEQSRGFGNNPSKYNKEIIDLIKKSFQLIENRKNILKQTA